MIDEAVSYKDIRDLKVERDVIEKLFFEKMEICNDVAREYYNQRKRNALASMTPQPEDDEKQRKFRIKKGQKDLLKLCVQFGHDAPCPKTEDELVTCRCCGEQFDYKTLIETYYRKTRFSRMILFDYIKNQPFYENKGFVSLAFEE